MAGKSNASRRSAEHQLETLRHSPTAVPRANCPVSPAWPRSPPGPNARLWLVANHLLDGTSKTKLVLSANDRPILRSTRTRNINLIIRYMFDAASTSSLNPGLLCAARPEVSLPSPIRCGGLSESCQSSMHVAIWVSASDWRTRRSTPSVHRKARNRPLPHQALLNETVLRPFMRNFTRW